MGFAAIMARVPALSAFLGALAAAALQLAPSVASARDTLGIYENWGAFREPGDATCFAIATPAQSAGSGDGGSASAAVGYWPRLGIRAHLAVRLSRAVAPSGTATLVVGDRRFALVRRGDQWTAPSTASDRAIIAAMRGARAMSISAVAGGGTPIVDAYDLRGAATAIDAAAFACLRIK